jgi:hypothetical protein
MRELTGALKIARFNWPWYAAAAGGCVVAAGLMLGGVLQGGWRVIGLAGLCAAAGWSLLSLLVSHYVYDRSPVARGAWLAGCASSGPRQVAVLHAGQDEASEITRRTLPGARLRSFDFYDAHASRSASLARARALAHSRASATAADRLPMDDGALDLALVVFAAHEIRCDDDRAAFLRELARCLTGNGRVLVVEHLRDAWNLLAYGPGAFHFLSRSTWLRSFAAGGLHVLRETTCTPFVRVFELGRRS